MGVYGWLTAHSGHTSPIPPIYGSTGDPGGRAEEFIQRVRARIFFFIEAEGFIPRVQIYSKVTSWNWFSEYWSQGTNKPHLMLWVHITPFLCEQNNFNEKVWAQGRVKKKANYPILMDKCLTPPSLPYPHFAKFIICTLEICFNPPLVTSPPHPQGPFPLLSKLGFSSIYF